MHLNLWSCTLYLTFYCVYAYKPGADIANLNFNHEYYTLTQHWYSSWHLHCINLFLFMMLGMYVAIFCLFSSILFWKDQLEDQPRLKLSSFEHLICTFWCSIKKIHSIQFNSIQFNSILSLSLHIHVMFLLRFWRDWFCFDIFSFSKSSLMFSSFWFWSPS